MSLVLLAQLSSHTPWEHNRKLTTSFCIQGVLFSDDLRRGLKQVQGILFQLNTKASSELIVICYQSDFPQSQF